jgi:hypothetical protein
VDNQNVLNLLSIAHLGNKLESPSRISHPEAKFNQSVALFKKASGQTTLPKRKLPFYASLFHFTSQINVLCGRCRISPLAERCRMFVVFDVLLESGLFRAFRSIV